MGDMKKEDRDMWILFSLFVFGMSQILHSMLNSVWMMTTVNGATVRVLLIASIISLVSLGISLIQEVED